MLTLRRAAVLLLFVSTLSTRPAQAEWQGGAGFYLGYNSQVVNPTQSNSNLRVGALTASLSPFVVWNGEYGRLTAYVRLQGEGNLFVLVPFSYGIGEAYRGTLIARVDTEISQTKTWSLAASSTAGRFNGGQGSAIPGNLPLEGLNIVATDFASVDGRSLFTFKEAPRVEASQQTVFRAFLPYNLASGGAAGTTGPSYSVDAQGVGAYTWQRWSLGGDILAGWFLPPAQGGTAPSSVGDRSIFNLRFGARTTVDLAPRLSAFALVGVSVVTTTGHFFAGSIVTPTGEKVPGTVVNPVGEFTLQRLFTRPEIETALTYSHSAAAEVSIGRFSNSDAITLRAIAPVHPDVSVTAEAAYRYSRGISFTDQPSPTFHQAQIDLTARWNFNEYVQLFGRYQFVYQVRVEQPLPGLSPVRDFNRHVVLFGLTFMYPARAGR